MKEEEVKEQPAKKAEKPKEPKTVKMRTLRAFNHRTGWLPRGEYEFSKKEAENLEKQGFAKKITK